MKGNPIIWITILMGSWTSLWSNPTILTLSELPDTAISIKSQLLLFADATRQMTWEEVYQQYQANQFRPFEGYPFKGELQRVNYEYWLYFSLDYQENTPKRVILRGFTDAKCFHLKDQRLVENLVVGRGITDNFKKGSKYAYSRRDIPILLLPGKNIFLIQKSPENRFHPNTIQPFLLKEELAIAKKDSTLNLYYLAFGLFLGFLSCVFVFICMQYSQSKHISYLYFALHILFFFLLNLRQLDISTPYFHFYPNLIYTHKSHNVFHLPIYLTFILFIRSFLNTKENFLQVDKVVRGIIFGIIVYFVLDRIIIFFDGIHYTYWIDRYVRPAFFVLSIYITLSFYKSKNKVVKYIANGIMSLVVLTLLGLILDRVMVKTWDWWDLAFIFTQLGVILEITFFALAIGHNVKIIEDDKNHAQFALQSQEQETQQLKELDQYKDQFYTNITHELRTPLTIIKGLTQQIKENPSVDLEERLSIVIKNTEGLHHLINQVLDLSKMEVGKVSVNNKQEDIIRPIKNWTDSFHSLASEKDIKLSFQANTTEWILSYDKDKLQKIINNLLLNALKFTPTYGSVKLSIQPYSYLASSSPSSQNFYQLNHFRLNASYIRITVQDTGKGLPVDKLPYIFDRYYQVETTAVSSIGTGIGLALTKELVTLLEGVIQVESELGGGSTFSIYLPVSNEPAVQAPKQEQMVSKEASFQLDLAIAPTSSIEDSRPIVLLVEDNLDVIYYLKTCIGKKYQVLETTNGKKGLEKAIEVIPDIIISDVMMPEMDGYELGKALQANSQTSHIPFLLLTAKTSQESKRQGLAAGALAYLTKPFDQEELLIRLQHLLAWRKQLQIFLLHQDQSSTPQLIKSTAAFNKERTFLDQVNQQILQHLEEEDFKAPQLAQAMAMSESQLYRKLKAVTDHSTAKYLQLTRLKEAQSMLETMDISISEVAHKVGFKQTSHFSKAFKAYFGKTPSEWSK